jgi:hypothetical protein
VGFVVDKVAMGRFSPSTSVSPDNIIPPLLHIHLSPPHEVCDCPDQAAHYHNLGPKLGASLLTRHIGWKQKRKEKKKKGNKLLRGMKNIQDNYCLSTDRHIWTTNNTCLLVEIRIVSYTYAQSFWTEGWYGSGGAC